MPKHYTKVSSTTYKGPKFKSVVDNKPTQIIKKKTAIVPGRYDNVEYSKTKPYNVKAKAKSMVRKAKGIK